MPEARGCLAARAARPVKGSVATAAPSMKSLEELRARLDVIDRELLELVAERQALGRQIAEVKRAVGQPTRDFRREREVLLKARRDAEALGVSPALAESLLRSLITGSLTTQERARIAAQGR